MHFSSINSDKFCNPTMKYIFVLGQSCSYFLLLELNNLHPKHFQKQGMRSSVRRGL